MAEVISQPGGAGTVREPSGPLQSEDRRKPNFDPSEDEKTVVQAWQQRVSRAEDETLAKKWRENLEKLRRYERGEQQVDDAKSRTNMVYATIAVQLPKLYAKNPTFAATPGDGVTQAEMGKVKRFCATAEKVIRKMLVEEGKLKKRAKANIRAACVTSFGVLKVIYQKELRGDPLAVRRIEDTQDNLARVEALIKDLKKTDDPAELAKKRDELRANLKALQSGNEIEIYKGFVIDRMRSEDFLVLDDNVAEFDEYVDAQALGHRIWMTVADARATFDMEMHGATRFGRPRGDASKTDDTPPDEQFICVLEIWDKKNGVVRTTAKGMNRWLREPYAPQCTPQRWYPFYVLGFNLTEGAWRPLSDVELLMSLQDEYDRTRQNYADVREKAVPKRIVRKGGNLSETDVKNIMDSGNKDWVAVEGNPATPINQDVMQLDGLKIAPEAYDVSQIRNDMDVVSGTSDAGRGNLIEAKTATEAEIMAEAMQSRLSERRDTHEDLLSEMGEAALEIALRDLSKDEVRQVAGNDAEWPETPQGVKEIFRQVVVRVRAGSSGKPNQAKEREQWGQLLPIIKETMVGVMELRAAGNLDMANAAIELLRETLRRYDEHLDLDAFIPPMEENGIGAQMQQMAQELTKTKEQLAQLTDEHAKGQEALAKAQQAEQAKVIEQQTKAKVAEEESRRKDEEFVREQARLDAESEHKRAMEREEMERRARMEADAAEREERMGSRKLETDERVAVRSAEIKGEVENRRIDAQKAANDAEREGGREQISALVNQLQEDMQRLEEMLSEDLEFEAERGDDGMPSKLKQKKKARGQKSTD
jgi:hypothetical protein